MKIPKIASFFWGGGPLSWLRYMTFWSFRKLHPDWEMRLYLCPEAVVNGATWTTGEPQDFPGNMAINASGQDYLPRLAAELRVKIEPFFPPAGWQAASAVHLADLCRWGALSKHGGWFFDTDLLFIDQMESLYQKWIGRNPENQNPDVAMIVCRDWLPTGFMGAMPENKFTSECYSFARAQPNFARYRSAGAETVMRLAGLDPAFFPPDRKIVKVALASSFAGTRFAMLHHLTAYRWEWYDAEQIFTEDQEAFAETVAIHWFGGTRVAQKFNRLWTEKNWREQKVCTLLHYIKNLVDNTSE